MGRRRLGRSAASTGGQAAGHASGRAGGQVSALEAAAGRVKGRVVSGVGIGARRGKMMERKISKRALLQLKCRQAACPCGMQRAAAGALSQAAHSLLLTSPPPAAPPPPPGPALPCPALPRRPARGVQGRRAGPAAEPGRRVCAGDCDRGASQGAGRRVAGGAGRGGGHAAGAGGGDSARRRCVRPLAHWGCTGAGRGNVPGAAGASGA